MELATLSNGYKLPYVGFGTYPLKGAELEQVLGIAYKTGYRLFDSAFLYQNESDIGNCLKKGTINRNDVFLTSKVQGIQYVGRKRFLYFDKKPIKKIYQQSCNRFCTDYLDVFLLHSPFKGYVNAYKELMKLYKEDRVKVIGVSNFDIEQLETIKRECDVYPLLNQIELHPYNTMKDLIKYCQDHQIQVEAYSPFGRGKIVGEIMENPKLKEIAANNGKTIGQIVIRWIVQQGIIVIPRSTNAERMKQNLDVFDFALTDKEMDYIDSLNQDRGFGAHFQKH